MDALQYLSAQELARAIRAREVSSLEVLDHFLARIERLNPAVNAVVTLDAERARDAARAADASPPRGPLHGVPMTVKDTYETAGVRTTAGAVELTSNVPDRDAVAVTRLKAAGAVIFGKTNTPRYAGDVQTSNPIFGATNNPWDVTRSPGGSSGGSAAALACGFTPMEIGSDIGGSIRNPAHCCGVYGHKPTHGIVPMQGHLPGALVDIDLAVSGPLARTAGDLALGLHVLAGPTAERAAAWRLELPPPRRTSVRDYTVGVWIDDPFCRVASGVGDKLHAAADALAAAGARVREAKPDLDLADAYRTYLRLFHAVESGGLPRATVEAMAAAIPDGDESAASRYARFTSMRHREWLSANEKRHHLRARWAEFFMDVDVLLCPIIPTVALPHRRSATGLTGGTMAVDGATRPFSDQLVWAGLVGMAWLPSTLAPVGLTPEGLPVGIQIVGPYLEDLTCLDVAGRLADLIGGFQAPPGY